MGTLIVALLERCELAGAGVGGIGEGMIAIATDNLASKAGGTPPPHCTRLATAFTLGFNLFVQPFIDDHRVGTLHLELWELSTVHLLAMGDVVVHESPL